MNENVKSQLDAELEHAGEGGCLRLERGVDTNCH